jgi:transcriptional regulator with XRE-family HTH domain
MLYHCYNKGMNMSGEKTVHFGDWVRKRRAELRLSLRKFAGETRLDPGNLSKYERGVLPPPQDPDTLERMAAVLQLKEGDPGRREFMDLAALGAGKIPADLVSDPKLLAKMPLLFRTIRTRNLTRQQLLELAERLKSL